MAAHRLHGSLPWPRPPPPRRAHLPERLHTTMVTPPALRWWLFPPLQGRRHSLYEGVALERLQGTGQGPRPVGPLRRRVGHIRPFRHSQGILQRRQDHGRRGLGEELMRVQHYLVDRGGVWEARHDLEALTDPPQAPSIRLEAQVVLRLEVRATPEPRNGGQIMGG